MFESSQKTIKESVQLEGVGLHNGIKVNLSLIPAEANSGIIFKRKDLDNSKNAIEASYKNVDIPRWKKNSKKLFKNYKL